MQHVDGLPGIQLVQNFRLIVAERHELHFHPGIFRAERLRHFREHVDFTLLIEYRDDEFSRISAPGTAEQSGASSTCHQETEQQT